MGKCANALFTSIIAFSLTASISLASDKVTIQAAQERLTELGFSLGTADGIWGKKTQSAVIQFQVDVGIPNTGSLDSATLEKLGIVGSSSKKETSNMSYSELLESASKAFREGKKADQAHVAANLFAESAKLFTEIAEKQETGETDSEQATKCAAYAYYKESRSWLIKAFNEHTKLTNEFLAGKLNSSTQRAYQRKSKEQSIKYNGKKSDAYRKSVETFRKAGMDGRADMMLRNDKIETFKIQELEEC